MVEMVLPGTYIEVRPEGLIVPGRVSVGTVGIIGTAAKGPLDKPTVLSGFLDARERFGPYDPWRGGAQNELTLVRAIEIAAAHGATTIVATRISALNNGQPVATSATYKLTSAGGDCVTLQANSPGTWGNQLTVQVVAADEPAFVGPEEHAGNAATLTFKPVRKSARNRVQLTTDADGVTKTLKIIYDDDAATPDANQVKINRATGAMTFASTLTLTANDTITAWYEVDPASAVTVVLGLGRAEERFTVVTGDDLLDDLKASAWVTGTKGTKSAEKPANVDDPAKFGTGDNTAGSNGEAAADGDYKRALDLLLNEDAHIIVGAGRTTTFADDLNGHCQLASGDTVRRDRIAVVGAGLGASLDDLRGHNIDSDRVVFAAPGIVFGDAAAEPPVDVTLPGAYAAAAVAGMLSSFPAHVSLTNKVLSVGELEKRYTLPELTQLVQARILALEARQGFRVVKAITTSSNTAWHQITTRRIVDYAKFGVRSAAVPYIGLLNNERVRVALRSTIASFLNEMVDDEMLISYELDVTATREQQRKGIVAVTIILRPTFSIDFIKVTMFLE